MNSPLHPHRTLQFGGRQEDKEARRIMKIVCEALMEKGYNPVSQITGNLSSGDTANITNHNNARNLIRSQKRDELIEELVRAYARDFV